MWIVVPGVLLLFVAANAHLVYVAFQSQPKCAAHVKGVAKAPATALRNRHAEETEMSCTDRSHWLLSETSGIGETYDPRLQRNLPLMAGLQWLAAGWRDMWVRPPSSLAYGLRIFVLSVAFVWTLALSGATTAAIMRRR